MEQNKIYNTDCLEGLKTIEDNSIDCCVTSPPYFGLRDYGHEGQIGLEETPEMYVNKIVQVFEEVRRVLKKEGTLWLNLGDSYANPGNKKNGEGETRNKSTDKFHGGGAHFSQRRVSAKFNNSIKQKDLIGIPWMVAFALRSRGWYLRQDIIWHKPNPMPESVTDRCTKAHEYIFLMSKGNKYYYDQDAIKEESIYQENRPPGVERNRLYGYDSKENNHPEAYRKSKLRGEYNGKPKGRMKAVGRKDLHGTKLGQSGQDAFVVFDKANKRSVWTITTKPYSEAHFATFPEDLIVDCIKAGCPEGGIVLDPFMGAGTTALVARKLNRNFIGFELNEEYIKIANNRLRNDLGMFQ
jgi:DNA modification methylase